MAEYSLQQFRFLVVDDNPHMLRMVAEVLRAFGAGQVMTAANGEAAVEVLHRLPVDIMICDYRMLPMNGIELVNYVRTARDSPNPYLGIIMLTGHTDMAKIMAARDCGINEIVAKPFAPETLRERIISIIENPRDFVVAKKYIGPDRRRRKNDDLAPGERRRAAP